jgi:hypothetical protein
VEGWPRLRGPGEILLLRPIFVPCGSRKEENFEQNKLVYHPKNIPTLSLLRIQSVQKFVNFSAFSGDAEVRGGNHITKEINDE